MRKSSLKGAAVLGMMAAALIPPEELGALLPKPEPPPRNKYNLTDEDIEKMSSMTPKEKKVFLKEKRHR